MIKYPIMLFLPPTPCCLIYVAIYSYKQLPHRNPIRKTAHAVQVLCTASLSAYEWLASFCSVTRTPLTPWVKV